MASRSRSAHQNLQRTEKSQDKSYISEYADFMEHFLADHPEALTDRETGIPLYWDRKVDLTALEQARIEAVPDDGYGFYHSSARHDANLKDHWHKKI